MTEFFFFSFPSFNLILENLPKTADEVVSRDFNVFMHVKLGRLSFGWSGLKLAGYKLRAPRLFAKAILKARPQRKTGV